MPEMVIAASPHDRIRTFLRVFYAAPDDADMELRLGRINRMGEMIPSVAISLCGTTHGFTAEEARALADIAEDAMQKFPDDPSSRTLPNLILMLRSGADKSEEHGK